MTRTSHPATVFAIFSILFALLAAPALAIAATSGDGPAKKVTGAGFVLMISLQRNAA